MHRSLEEMTTRQVAALKGAATKDANRNAEAAAEVLGKSDVTLYLENFQSSLESKRQLLASLEKNGGKNEWITATQDEINDINYVIRVLSLAENVSEIANKKVDSTPYDPNTYADVSLRPTLKRLQLLIEEQPELLKTENAHVGVLLQEIISKAEVALGDKEPVSEIQEKDEKIKYGDPRFDILTADLSEMSSEELQGALDELTELLKDPSNIALMDQGQIADYKVRVAELKRTIKFAELNEGDTVETPEEDKIGTDPKPEDDEADDNLEQQQQELLEKLNNAQQELDAGLVTLRVLLAEAGGLDDEVDGDKDKLKNLLSKANNIKAIFDKHASLAGEVSDLKDKEDLPANIQDANQKMADAYEEYKDIRTKLTEIAAAFKLLPEDDEADEDPDTDDGNPDEPADDEPGTDETPESEHQKLIAEWNAFQAEVEAKTTVLKTLMDKAETIAGSEDPDKAKMVEILQKAQKIKNALTDELQELEDKFDEAEDVWPKDVTEAINGVNEAFDNGFLALYHNLTLLGERFGIKIDADGNEVKRGLRIRERFGNLKRGIRGIFLADDEPLTKGGVGRYIAGSIPVVGDLGRAQLAFNNQVQRAKGKPTRRRSRYIGGRTIAEAQNTTVENAVKGGGRLVRNVFTGDKSEKKTNTQNERIYATLKDQGIDLTKESLESEEKRRLKALLLMVLTDSPEGIVEEAKEKIEKFITETWVSGNVKLIREALKEDDREVVYDMVKKDLVTLLGRVGVDVSVPPTTEDSEPTTPEPDEDEGDDAPETDDGEPKFDQERISVDSLKSILGKEEALTPEDRLTLLVALRAAKTRYSIDLPITKHAVEQSESTENIQTLVMDATNPKLQGRKVKSFRKFITNNASQVADKMGWEDINAE